MSGPDGLAALLGLLNLDETLGAALIGFCVSSVLYGVCSNQVYNYFQRFPHDKLAYKLLVIGILLLETFHQALVGIFYYHYGVTNYLKPAALLIPEWALIVQVTIGALIAVVVKSCFAMRVYRFSGGNIPLTLFIMVLNTAELVLAIFFTVKAFHMTTFLQLPELKWLTSATLGVGVGTDVVVTCALVFFLLRIRTGYARSDSPVNQLIRYAVNTGVLTCTASIACLVSFDIMPENFVFIAFYFVLSKLYANALLATFNTRRAVKGKGTDAEHAGDSGGLSYPLQSRGGRGLSDKSGRSYLPNSAFTQHSVEVDIRQEVSIVADPTPLPQSYNGGFKDFYGYKTPLSPVYDGSDYSSQYSPRSAGKTWQ